MRKLFYIGIISLIIIAFGGCGTDLTDCDDCNDELNEEENDRGDARCTKMEWPDDTWCKNCWWDNGVNITFCQWDKCGCDITKYKYTSLQTPDVFIPIKYEVGEYTFRFGDVIYSEEFPMIPFAINPSLEEQPFISIKTISGDEYDCEYIYDEHDSGITTGLILLPTDEDISTIQINNTSFNYVY